MRKQNFLLLVFSLFVIFVFTSCDLILLKTGKATVSIENKIEDSSIYVEKTSKNATTVFIGEYIITANGPHGKKISKTVDANEATASFDSMLVGNWNIKVEAIDNNNITIGEGSANIRIEEEKENFVTIDIEEKTGEGKLVVNIKYNSSPLTEIKVTSEKDSANTVREKLLEDKAIGGMYYSTAIDIDNGVYIVDIIENNDVKYSDKIRIINGEITYFSGDLGDSAETTKIKSKLARTPVVMFQPAEITVALNGTLSQNPTIFHQDYPRNNIFYEWKYNDEILTYGKSIPLKWELESSRIIPKVGENVLTFSIKIGNINEAKTIASEDFHFYVTDCVTENSLSDAINSLPNNYDCGILSSSVQNRKNRCELENKNVLLSDNTYAILSTKDNEFIELTTHKSIKNKTIDNNYNSISGRIEITHNDKTSYYVMDKDNFYSYISFYVTNSSEKLCATNIRASNVLKDGVDISDDQAELEKLASYFVALLSDEKNQDITYLDDIYSYNRSTFNYSFEDYKAGPYSLDGTVKIEKYGDNINDDPCKIHVKPNLTFKKDNDKIALSFEVNYQISNKQYSNFELKSLIMNGKEFSTDKLSDSSIEKIKSFVGYLIQ